MLYSLPVLFALFALSASAQESSVAGKWEIQTSAAGRESTHTCTFAQSETTVTGTCATSRGEVKISGKVEGKAVTFTYKTDSEGGPVTVVYKGTLTSPTAFSGSVTAVEFSVEGEFTAKQAK